jgi:hypothetical protein
MDPLEQAKNLIEKSQNIYIFLPENCGFSLTEGDIFSAGSAFFYSLKKLGKNVNLFLEKIPKNFQFLANPNFVISINTQEEDISQIFYEKNAKNLKIYLTSSRENLNPEDISFSSQNFLQNNPLINPDLIITLGVQSLEGLGKNFEQNPSLFYQIPVLNIDNNPENQNFGEVNLVGIKAPSISEILVDLSKLFEQDLLDEEIVTRLLAGIIWTSENFRNPRTKPETFEKASFLIERGADHQKIIQNFYKTKSISQIKLLGQILKKLSFNSEKELYFSALTQKDFEESKASSKDLGEALQELKFNFGNSACSNLLILWESHSSPPLVKGIFYSRQLNLIEKILENFEGISRGKAALFLIREKGLNAAYQKFLKLT